MQKISILTISLVLFLFSGCLSLSVFAQSIQRINHADLINTIHNDNGRAVLVVFWATWCRPCRKELPELKNLRDSFSKEELKVLGISIDYDPQKLAAFLSRYSFNFPIYLATADTTNIFRVQGVPKMMLYDQKGQCVFSHAGKYPLSKLKGQISKVLER